MLLSVFCRMKLFVEHLDIKLESVQTEVKSSCCLAVFCRLTLLVEHLDIKLESVQTEVKSSCCLSVFFRVKLSGKIQHNG